MSTVDGDDNKKPKYVKKVVPKKSSDANKSTVQEKAIKVTDFHRNQTKYDLF